MQWTRSETLAMASSRCPSCQGLGLRKLRQQVEPCQCVLKNIFKECLHKFRECALRPKHLSYVTLDNIPTGIGNACWSRKDEEYIADFCLIAKRTLSEDEYRLFRFHYLLGADWKLCCFRLRLPRGEFFRQVARLTEKLGRAFRETQPYGLFPTDEYFGSYQLRSKGPASANSVISGTLSTLRPPLRVGRRLA